LRDHFEIYSQSQYPKAVIEPCMIVSWSLVDLRMGTGCLRLARSENIQSLLQQSGVFLELSEMMPRKNSMKHVLEIRVLVVSFR
jgi:hypothetical protein